MSGHSSSFTTIKPCVAPSACSLPLVFLDRKGRAEPARAASLPYYHRGFRARQDHRRRDGKLAWHWLYSLSVRSQYVIMITLSVRPSVSDARRGPGSALSPTFPRAEASHGHIHSPRSPFPSTGITDADRDPRRVAHWEDADLVRNHTFAALFRRPDPAVKTSL